MPRERPFERPFGRVNAPLGCIVGVPTSRCLKRSLCPTHSRLSLSTRDWLRSCSCTRPRRTLEFARRSASTAVPLCMRTYSTRPRKSAALCRHSEPFRTVRSAADLGCTRRRKPRTVRLPHIARWSSTRPRTRHPSTSTRPCKASSRCIAGLSRSLRTRPSRCNRSRPDTWSTRRSPPRTCHSRKCAPVRTANCIRTAPSTTPRCTSCSACIARSSRTRTLLSTDRRPLQRPRNRRLRPSRLLPAPQDGSRTRRRPGNLRVRKTFVRGRLRSQLQPERSGFQHKRRLPRFESQDCAAWRPPWGASRGALSNPRASRCADPKADRCLPLRPLFARRCRVFFPRACLPCCELCGDCRVNCTSLRPCRFASLGHPPALDHHGLDG